jgi:hypothetical protein
VPDDVAHQDIEDIVVDGNRFTKSRHGGVGELLRSKSHRRFAVLRFFFGSASPNRNFRA